MYRSASLDLPSDGTDMPPPPRPLSTITMPNFRFSTHVGHRISFGDTVRARGAAVSANLHAKSVSKVPDMNTNPNIDIEATGATKVGDDETSGKRKAKGVDMRPFKKQRLLESLTEMVKVHIGTKARPETVLVHKNLLCAASPFFEAACKPEWQNHAEYIVNLPEDDPELIKALVYWIYNREIVYLDIWKRLNPTRGLVKTYLLAEKYLMPQLQNDVIDAIVHEIVDKLNFIYPKDFTLIYDSTPPNSKLRLLAINSILHRPDTLHLNYFDRKEYHQDFVWDLMVAFTKDKDNGGKAKQFLTSNNHHCKRYHVHEDGQQGRCTALKLPQNGDSELESKSNEE